jgi:hypothetical protein
MIVPTIQSRTIFSHGDSSVVEHSLCWKAPDTCYVNLVSRVIQSKCTLVIPRFREEKNKRRTMIRKDCGDSRWQLVQFLRRHVHAPGPIPRGKNNVEETKIRVRLDGNQSTWFPILGKNRILKRLDWILGKNIHHGSFLAIVQAEWELKNKSRESDTDALRVSHCIINSAIPSSNWCRRYRFCFGIYDGC